MAGLIDSTMNYVWNNASHSELSDISPGSPHLRVTNLLSDDRDRPPDDSEMLFPLETATYSSIQHKNMTTLDANGTYFMMMENVTGQPLPTFNQISIIRTVVLGLMFVISFFGNTATLIQVYRRRKSTINLLILHLATADLIVTFFCNVTDAIWASTIQWYAGSGMCKLLKFLQVFGLYLSTYIIVIISVDRCFAILDPMSRNKAPKRVRIMIGAAWIFSAIFALPQTYVFRVQRGPFLEDFYQCVTFGAYTADWQEQLYSCLSVLLMFILPLVAMVTAYLLIFCTIAQKSRDLQKEVDGANTEMLSRGPVRGQLFQKAKVKSLRMTALIVVAFIICWTPYYVLFIILVFLPPDREPMIEKYVLWIFFFGMANSMVNPMIYGAFQICKKQRRNKNKRLGIRPQTPFRPIDEI